MGKGSMRAAKPQMPAGCQPLISPHLGQCHSPLKEKQEPKHRAGELGVGGELEGPRSTHRGDPEEP